MREQEAQTWVARVIRIWQLTDIEVSYRRGESLTLLGSVSPGMQFRGDFASHDIIFTLSEGKYAIQCMGNSIFVVPHDEAVRANQWSVPYLSLFRRNCWLSGCAIEASAHEKMEWIQGCTREEIETETHAQKGAPE